MSKAGFAGIKSSNTVTNIPTILTLGDLYIFNDKMSIKPEHLKSAMHFNGFTSSEFYASILPNTYLYLGDKELTRPELQGCNCFVQITRTLFMESGQAAEYSDFKINRFYEGC